MEWMFFQQQNQTVFSGLVMMSCDDVSEKITEPMTTFTYVSHAKRAVWLRAREQDGSRLGAGWEQARGRLGAGWEANQGAGLG